MSAIVMCLVFVNMYFGHLSSVFCVLMVKGLFVVVNIMLSLTSVMTPPDL